MTTTLVAGCAHRPATEVPTERTPSNAAAPATSAADAGRIAPLTQLYQHVAAAQAVLVTEPDARGVRFPVCRVNVAGRRHLVPSYIAVHRTGSNESYGLPECQGEQLDQIAGVAGLATRPTVAAGPLLVPVVACGVYLGLGAWAAYKSIVKARDFRERKSRAARAAIGAGMGAGAVGFTAGGVAGGAGIGYFTPALGVRAGGILGTLCAGAGLAVGYLLVPPE